MLVWCLMLLAVSPFAAGSYEEVVDSLLATVSQRVKGLTLPNYADQWRLKFDSASVLARLNGYSGHFLLSKLSRVSDVKYSSDESSARFELVAKVEGSVSLQYTMTVSSSTVSSGSGEGTFSSELHLVVTARANGCSLQLRDTQGKGSFSVYFQPVDKHSFPVQIDYITEDRLPSQVYSSISNTLRREVAKLDICDIVGCY